MSGRFPGKTDKEIIDILELRLAETHRRAEKFRQECDWLRVAKNAIESQRDIYEAEHYELSRDRDKAIEGLEQIANRPTTERNPDGEDQAAETMKLIASEYLKILWKKCPHNPEQLKCIPIGMYHCPECSRMVIAGLPHP